MKTAANQTEKQTCPGCARLATPHIERYRGLLSALAGFMLWLSIAWEGLVNLELSAHGAFSLAVYLAILGGLVPVFVYVVEREAKKNRHAGRPACPACARALAPMPLKHRRLLGWLLGAALWALVACRYLDQPTLRSQLVVSLAVLAAILAGCALVFGRLARGV